MYTKEPPAAEFRRREICLGFRSFYWPYVRVGKFPKLPHFEENRYNRFRLRDPVIPLPREKIAHVKSDAMDRFRNSRPVGLTDSRGFVIPHKIDIIAFL